MLNWALTLPLYIYFFSIGQEIAKAGRDNFKLIRPALLEAISGMTGAGLLYLALAKILHLPHELWPVGIATDLPIGIFLLGSAAAKTRNFFISFALADDFLTLILLGILLSQHLNAFSAPIAAAFLGMALNQIAPDQFYKIAHKIALPIFFIAVVIKSISNISGQLNFKIILVIALARVVGKFVGLTFGVKFFNKRAELPTVKIALSGVAGLTVAIVVATAVDNARYLSSAILGTFIASGLAYWLSLWLNPNKKY
jgi:hypothetical protein